MSINNRKSRENTADFFNDDFEVVYQEDTSAAVMTAAVMTAMKTSIMTMKIMTMMTTAAAVIRRDSCLLT